MYAFFLGTNYNRLDVDIVFINSYNTLMRGRVESEGRDQPDDGSRIPKVTDHMGLVRQVARRFRNTGQVFGMEQGDLEQTAALGFMRKAPTYDPGKGLVTTIMLPTMTGTVLQEMRDRA